MDLINSFQINSNVQFDVDELLIVPLDTGFFTSLCPHRIKIPELSNTGGMRTSLDDLSLPSPRLMQI